MLGWFFAVLVASYLVPGNVMLLSYFMRLADNLFVFAGFGGAFAGRFLQVAGGGLVLARRKVMLARRGPVRGGAQ
jgi:hypothetical protein